MRLLPTGGFRSSRCSSIHLWMLMGVRFHIKTSDGRYALQFDGDGRRQGGHLHGGTAGLVVLEVLGVQAVVGGEIPLHIREEHGHVHEPVPAGARVLQDVAHVVEHRAALGLDVIAHDLALAIQGHTGYLLAAALARTHAREEQQAAHAPGMGVETHRFRRLGGVYLLAVHRRGYPSSFMWMKSRLPGSRSLLCSRKSAATAWASKLPSATRMGVAL